MTPFFLEEQLSSKEVTKRAANFITTMCNFQALNVHEVKFEKILIGQVNFEIYLIIEELDRLLDENC